MRIAALIFGILGGLAAGALGMTWMSDLAEYEHELELAAKMGIDVAGLRTAAYLLLLALPLGIASGVMALRGKGRIAGPTMLAAGVLPAIFEPKALVFTFLLIIGGLMSFAAKPKPARP
jgi:hypothetical protein